MVLDYYSILELDPEATPDDIQRAYRKLALQFHPFRYAKINKESNLNVTLKESYLNVCSKCRSIKKEEVFYRIAEAYDVLSSPKFKALYDEYGEESIKNGVILSSGSKDEVNDLISYKFHGNPYKVFRKVFGINYPFKELRFSDIDLEYKFISIPEETPILEPSKAIEFPVTLEDVYYGCKKLIKLDIYAFSELYNKTDKEGRIFEIIIPAGCPDGRTFTFLKATDRGRHMIPGDITFVAKLQPHDHFKRDENDLVITKFITLADALLGCVLNLTTFDNKTIDFPLTTIAKPNDRIEIANEGLRIENSKQKGKLIVILKIEFPDSISDTQRKLLEEAFLENN